MCTTLIGVTVALYPKPPPAVVPSETLFLSRHPSLLYHLTPNNPTPPLAVDLVPAAWLMLVDFNLPGIFFWDTEGNLKVMLHPQHNTVHNCSKCQICSCWLAQSTQELQAPGYARSVIRKPGTQPTPSSSGQLRMTMGLQSGVVDIHADYDIDDV